MLETRPESVMLSEAKHLNLIKTADSSLRSE